jgi:FkbM family methyltransferase
MSDLNTKWVLENFGDRHINFFDIGASHVSADAMFFKTVLSNATIYAFECAEIYREHNFQFSGWHDIKYFHCAFSDHDGIDTYYPSDTFNGLVHPYSGSICKPTTTTVSSGEFVWGDPYTVESIRLDTFCNKHNVSPDIIHIDVQGAEYKVLSSMGNYRPLCIWAEVNEFENCYETNIKYKDFNELMTTLGYTKYHSSGLDELYVLNNLTVTPYYVKN